MDCFVGKHGSEAEVETAGVALGDSEPQHPFTLGKDAGALYSFSPRLPPLVGLVRPCHCETSKVVPSSHTLPLPPSTFLPQGVSPSQRHVCLSVRPLAFSQPASSWPLQYGPAN